MEDRDFLETPRRVAAPPSENTALGRTGDVSKKMKTGVKDYALILDKGLTLYYLSQCSFTS